MTDKLDPTICFNFRNAINESPTIPYEKGRLYDLCCAVMDRLDSSVKYLNEHWDYPDSEEDFICFLVFGCILSEGVDRVFDETIKTRPKCNDEMKFFKDCCLQPPISLPENDCPTDEQFFLHLRAIAFAHPYETSHNQSFKNMFGTLVSPWVIVNQQARLIDYGFSEPIGVRVYASKKKGWDSICDVVFPFSALKGFLIEKYSALEDVIQWIKKDSQNTFDEWKKDKVARNLNPCEILRDICRILNNRHESTSEIDTMIEYLECHVSNEINNAVVTEYKDYLIDLIPGICDSVDQLDSSKLFEQERCIDTFYPTGLHQNAYYQLEKIFSYLKERHSHIEKGSDEDWGLKQAEVFYKEFASKWIHMDVYNMDYTEIKLLITVALFKECKEQGRLSVR